MDTKALALPVDAMVDEGAGSFAGYASLFDVLDSQGDIVVKGAYTDTLPQFLERGFIAWGHDWLNPVATVREAREDNRGLRLVADFHSDALSQTARTRTRERLERGKFMGLSIGFQTVSHQMTPEARLLKKIDLFETSLVTVPALREAGVTHAKGVDLEQEAELRAVWSAAQINDLPDSSFAIILPGGEKDSDGKTVPRSLRKLPHHGPSGAVDLPHLRAALSRLPQADLPPAAAATAKSHLEGHATGAGVGERDAQHLVEHLVATVAELKVGRRFSQASRREIQAAIDALAALIQEVTADEQEDELTELAEKIRRQPVAGMAHLSSGWLDEYRARYRLGGDT